MSGDLDIEVKNILITDDAARIKQQLPIEKRRARYSGNGLPKGSANLTEEELQTLGNCMSPKRPGYIEAIKSVLK